MVSNYANNSLKDSNKELNEFNEKLKILNKELNDKIIGLEEEIKKLKSKDKNNADSITNLENKIQLSVNKLVDDMLNNDDINSPIPDFIERKIYTNVFTILIGVMKEVVEDANINVLNQNIKIKMTPE